MPANTIGSFRAHGMWSLLVILTALTVTAATSSTRPLQRVVQSTDGTETKLESRVSKSTSAANERRLLFRPVRSCKVTSMQLYNSVTKTKIQDLTNGMVVRVGDIAGMITPSFDIQATATAGSGRRKVHSVQFAHNNSNERRTASSSPFSFCAANSQKCGAILGYGTHTVTATPYVKRFGRVRPGVPQTVTFTIEASSNGNNNTSGNTPVAPAAPVSEPSPASGGSPVMPAALPSPVATAAPVDSPKPCPTVEAFINSIKLSSNRALLTMNGTSAEDQAMQWLSVNDTLQLNACSASNRFRLQQRFALLTLWFQQLVNMRWRNGTHWTTTDDECRWFGVTCGHAVMVPNDDGNGAAQLAVTELKLRSNLIRGTLPADFGLLSSMVAVDFSDNNNVQGSLPSSLASWSNLTSLSTLNTGLSGVLSDSLADAWSNLQTFSVGGLDGTIPSSLSRWVKAKHMDFVGSKMVGTLPEALLQLTNLEYFRITSSNNAGLNGTIPAGVGSWTNMKTLIVHGQRFAGSIPDALQQLTNMQVFQMSGNAFLNGTFPEWIGPAWNKNLTSLRLSGSRLLKGQLPASIGMLTKLTSLDVNGNAFSGTFPASLWNLTNVTVAYLSGNMFNDTVPSTFCQKGRTIFVDRNKVNCTCCI